MIDYEKINKIRKEKKITGHKLSELSGIPYTTIAKITAGYIKNPRQENINAIAKVLDVPAPSLLIDEEYDECKVINFIPTDIVKLLSVYFILNSSSTELIKSLFGSENIEKTIPAKDINTLIPAYTALRESLKESENSEQVVKAVTILSKHPQLIKIVLQCDGKPDEYLDKLSDMQDILDK